MTRLLDLMLASRWVDLLLVIVVALALLLLVNGAWALCYWRLNERLQAEIRQLDAHWQERMRRSTHRHQAETERLNHDWLGQVVGILRGTAR